MRFVNQFIRWKFHSKGNDSSSVSSRFILTWITVFSLSFLSGYSCENDEQGESEGEAKGEELKKASMEGYAQTMCREGDFSGLDYQNCSQCSSRIVKKNPKINRVALVDKINDQCSKDNEKGNSSSSEEQYILAVDLAIDGLKDPRLDKSFSVTDIRQYPIDGKFRRVATEHLKQRKKRSERTYTVKLHTRDRTLTAQVPKTMPLIHESFKGDRIGGNHLEEKRQVSFTAYYPVDDSIALSKISKIMVSENEAEKEKRSRSDRNSSKSSGGSYHAKKQAIQDKKECDVRPLFANQNSRSKINKKKKGINLIFAGVGTELSIKELKKRAKHIIELPKKSWALQDWGSDGLFKREPFKSNVERFNFWYVDEVAQKKIPKQDRDGSRGEVFCSDVCSHKLINPNRCQLSNAYMMNLCHAECRSSATLGGRAFISTEEELSRFVRVAVHEWGHSFGRLADEYTEQDKGEEPRYPNCANSQDEMKDWLNGWTDGDQWLYSSCEADNCVIGSHQGCSYTDENWRFMEETIMRSTSQSNDFGPINTLALCGQIALQTGQCHFKPSVGSVKTYLENLEFAGVAAE